MKKTTHKSLIIALTIALTSIILYLIIGNHCLSLNNYKLKKSIKAIESETVYINDVVPFKWEEVYTFSPYADKEYIEKTIGFTSKDIKANNINEGMTHLIFTQNKKVVACILAYSENLGYDIKFNSKITLAENAKFKVTKNNNVISLSLI